MSTAEMRWEMVKTVNHLSDDVLVEALALLKKLDHGNEHSIFNQANLDKHFARYDEVLKKLAQ